MRDGDGRFARKSPVSARRGSKRSAVRAGLAKLADLYVNDAFARPIGPRQQVGVTRFIAKSAMGFLMEKELKYLHEELDHPAKPFLVIMGGAKVSDKSVP